MSRGSHLGRYEFRVFPTLVVLSSLLWTGVAWSQPALRLQASFGSELEQTSSLAASIGFDGAFAGPIRLAGDVVLGADPGADLRARGTITFGPLGLVLVETLAGVRIAGDPSVAGSLRAQGNLGPIAAQLFLSARTSDQTRFTALLDEPPSLSGRAWGASLRLSGRISGTWIAEALVEQQRSTDARFFRAHVDGRARRGVSEGIDPVMYARLSAIDALQVWGVGGGVILTERRSPEVSFRAGVEAWLDDASLQLAPALSVTGARSIAPGLLSWNLSYQAHALENEFVGGMRLRMGASEAVVWTVGVDGHARNLRVMEPAIGVRVSIEAEVP